jgi:hypothetical protein
MDQLSAMHVEFRVRGMLGNGLLSIVDPSAENPPDIRPGEDDDGGDLDGDIIAEVQLAQKASAYLTNSLFYMVLIAYSSKDPL